MEEVETRMVMIYEWLGKNIYNVCVCEDIEDVLEKGLKLRFTGSELLCVCVCVCVGVGVCC